MSVLFSCVCALWHLMICMCPALLFQPSSLHLLIWPLCFSYPLVVSPAVSLSLSFSPSIFWQCMSYPPTCVCVCVSWVWDCLMNPFFEAVGLPPTEMLDVCAAVWYWCLLVMNREQLCTVWVCAREKDGARGGNLWPHTDIGVIWSRFVFKMCVFFSIFFTVHLLTVCVRCVARCECVGTGLQCVHCGLAVPVSICVCVCEQTGRGADSANVTWVSGT